MKEKQYTIEVNPSRTTYEPVEVNLALLARPEDRDRFEAEWSKFFRGYHARLEDFFGYSMSDWDDRDQLVQDIFIRAYRAIVISGHALRSKEAAWCWLIVIGKNLIRDRHAKEKTAAAMMERYAREAAIEEELRLSSETVLTGLAEDDSDALGWKVPKATFEQRLSQLSDNQRRILRLRILESFGWNEIAEREGRTSAAVRKEYSRMRRFLSRGS